MKKGRDTSGKNEQAFVCIRPISYNYQFKDKKRQKLSK
jgi:hypothetical protein